MSDATEQATHHADVEDAPVKAASVSASFEVDEVDLEAVAGGAGSGESSAPLVRPLDDAEVIDGRGLPHRPYVPKVK